MDRTRVVLDASVLYPAAPRDTLLRAAAAGIFLPAWSAEILEEVGRNLVFDAHVGDDQVRRLLAIMRRRFPLAEAIGYEDLIDRLTNNPHDRHVLAVAIVAEARVIVTSNLRHFPAAALQPIVIEAQSPDGFLLDLIDKSPQRMLRTIREQAAALNRPPMIVEEVLSGLALHAPQFAAECKQRIG